MEVQSPNQEKVLKTFSPRNISIALVLGFGVAGWMLWQDIKDPVNRAAMIETLSNPNWLWFLGAIGVLLARDLGYVYRIRHLTNKELTIKGSVFTVLLWEFASAVTPSVVGGTAVAVFILNREGIKLGKSLAYVMLTAILDNSYFIIAAPLFINLTDSEILSGGSITTLFIVSYSLIVLYTLLMAFGLLVRPKAFKSLMLALTHPTFLKAIFLGRFGEKWRTGAEKLADETIMASEELKGKGLKYWSKAILSTLYIWTARYFMLNCLWATFNPQHMDFAAHMDAFANQILLWITQLISPTPGGAGLSMYFFKQIFGTLISPEIQTTISFIWRLMTFYLYLLIGFIALRKWIPRTIKLQGKQE